MLAFYSIFDGKGKKKRKNKCFHPTLNDRKYFHLPICLKHRLIKKVSYFLLFTMYTVALVFFLSFTNSHMDYNSILFNSLLMISSICLSLNFNLKKCFQLVLSYISYYSDIIGRK